MLLAQENRRQSYISHLGKSCTKFIQYSIVYPVNISMLDTDDIQLIRGQLCKIFVQ